MLKFEVPEGVSITDNQLIDGISLYSYDYDEDHYVLKDTVADFMGSVVNDKDGLGEYVVIDFTTPASSDEYNIERICLKSGSTEIAVSGDTYISKEEGKNLKVRLSAQFNGASKCRFERTSINLPYATPYREGVVRFVSGADYYDPDLEDNDEDNNIKSHLVYSAADVDKKITDTVTDIGDRFVSWDTDSDNEPIQGNLTVSQLAIESDRDDGCAAILTCTTTSDFDGSLNIYLNGLHSDSEVSADVNSYLRGNFILSTYVANSDSDNGWYTYSNWDKIPTVHAVDGAIKDIASDLQKQIDGINAGQNLADIVNDRDELSEYNISNLKADGDEYTVPTGDNEYETHTFTVGDKIQVLQDIWDDSVNDGEGGENPDLDGVGTIYELVKGKSGLGDNEATDVDVTGNARDINVNKSDDDENPDWYHWEYVGPYGVNGNEYVKLVSTAEQDITSDLNIDGNVTIKNITISENSITSNTTDSGGNRHASITLDSYNNIFEISLNDETSDRALKIHKPDDSDDFYSVTGDAVADYSDIEENTPTSYTDGRLVTVDYMQDAITKNTPISQPLDTLSNVNADYSVGLFLYTKPGDDLPIGSIVAGADLRPVGLTLPLSGQISYKSSANNNTYTGQWKLLSMAIKRTDVEPCLVIAQKCVVVLEPLNFTARTANSSVALNINEFGTLDTSYKYSLDNTTWQTYNIGDVITLNNIGNKVYFKGHRSQQDNVNYLQFSMNGEIAAAGNVYSLLDENNYNAITDLTSYGDYTFYNLFGGCTSLTSAPELPATTLTDSCYYSMFNGCDHLTSAPELQATTLTIECYHSMLRGCTSLTSAPELPATNLAYECYRMMFLGCTSLTSAPELPATVLPAGGYDSMFYGCTSLTSAPDLPATNLELNCYMRMFKDCTSLNKVKCYATDITATQATFEWLDNVSSTGNFYQVDGVDWNYGSGLIPLGWDVYYI